MAMAMAVDMAMAMAAVCHYCDYGGDVVVVATATWSAPSRV